MMTRRNFAGFIGMICVSMVGNLERMNRGLKANTTTNRDHHIRNRRLFNLAAGTSTLVGWERDHLHECALCQRMGFVLIRSIDRFPDLKFKHIRS